MKSLRRLCAAAALTLTLTLTALAGDMATGVGIAPPPPGVAAPGDIQIPPRSESETTGGEAVAVDPTWEIVLGLLRGVLSLF